MNGRLDNHNTNQETSIPKSHDEVIHEFTKALKAILNKLCHYIGIEDSQKEDELRGKICLDYFANKLGVDKWTISEIIKPNKEIEEIENSLHEMLAVYGKGASSQN